MDIFDDGASYKKDKHANLSKAKKKSKHKHEYEMFMMEYPFKSPYTGEIIYHHSIATYCTICGKIGDAGLFRLVTLPNGMTRLMNDEELVEKYKNLPLVRTDNYWIDNIKLDDIKVTCKDCKYLMFSDSYGECMKGYKGVVPPWDFCQHGERK